jgi:pyridoxal phosphate enzyme (YggS family)
MESVASRYRKVVEQLAAGVILVAVTKTRSIEELKDLYDCGHRIFGENRVQELLEKKPQLPNDVSWHLIGTLQTNKVKQVLPHVALIHSVDRLSLLECIDKEAGKLGIKAHLLLQVHIASEETKHGFSEEELRELIKEPLSTRFPNVEVLGLMGMATFTEDEKQVRDEFKSLFRLYTQARALHPAWSILSMGMSGDYQLAMEEGSNMVRVGSALFGPRS